MRIGGAQCLLVFLWSRINLKGIPNEGQKKKLGKSFLAKNVCNIGKMQDKICKETSTLFPCMQNTAKKTTKTSFIKQFRKNIEELQNKMIKFVEK